MNKIHKTTSSDPIAMVSSRLPIRLSPQQAEAIRSVVKDAGAVRMGHSEYMAVHRRLKSITVPKLDITRPALYLKNIAPGYSRSEFTLLPEFNPTTDIPEGYGVYSMHDGGANHKIGNAASLAWTLRFGTFGLPIRRKELIGTRKVRN